MQITFLIKIISGERASNIKINKNTKENTEMKTLKYRSFIDMPFISISQARLLATKIHIVL